MTDHKITPFLTYPGTAEEAMTFYVSLFEQSEVLSIERYGPDEAGTEGTIKLAEFSLKGQRFLCSDTNYPHAWTFTPAVSLMVRCISAAEIEGLYSRLGKEGQVLMPLGPYPFAGTFAWVADRFGVSWQLMLEET